MLGRMDTTTSPWTPWTETVTSTREIDDRTADALALRELIQRRLWAAEVGLDPDATDLRVIPPVAPGRDQAAA